MRLWLAKTRNCPVFDGYSHRLSGLPEDTYLLLILLTVAEMGSEDDGYWLDVLQPLWGKVELDKGPEYACLVLVTPDSLY